VPRDHQGRDARPDARDFTDELQARQVWHRVVAHHQSEGFGPETKLFQRLKTRGVRPHHKSPGLELTLTQGDEARLVVDPQGRVAQNCRVRDIGPGFGRCGEVHAHGRPDVDLAVDGSESRLSASTRALMSTTDPTTNRPSLVWTGLRPISTGTRQPSLRRPRRRRPCPIGRASAWLR
jgi:hypothetical protein